MPTIRIWRLEKYPATKPHTLPATEKKIGFDDHLFFANFFAYKFSMGSLSLALTSYCASLSSADFQEKKGWLPCAVARLRNLPFHLSKHFMLHTNLFPVSDSHEANFSMLAMLVAFSNK